MLSWICLQRLLDVFLKRVFARGERDNLPYLAIVMRKRFAADAL